MNNLSNLTIIIVTFLTNKKTLLNCLKSIDKRVKVVIVENSQKFKNKNFFISKFKNIKIFCTGKNLGYGGGNNFGLKRVKTSNVLILNPDSILDKYFFKNLNFILNNKSFSLIGCDLINNKGFATGGYFNLKKNNFFKKNFSLIKRDNFTKVDWVTGNSMLLNLRNLKNKKLFDENFFLFFEEFDLCRRTLNKGGKIFASKNLYVKHLGHKGSLAADPKYEKETAFLRSWHWMWSSFYYYEKNFSYFYALKCMYGKFFRSIIKMIFYRVFYNSIKFKMYHGRVSGIWNRLIGKKSWYRLKIY